MVTSEQKLFKEMRDDVLQRRARQEMVIKDWAEKLSHVNPEVYKSVDLPAEISLKSFIPEYYQENPRQEVIERQYENMVKVMTEMNKICDTLNERGRECLLKHQAVISNQPR